MSRWFRIYDELLDDPKVQRLPPEDFKGWVNLLCLASRNEGRLPPVADIAFALRETESCVSLLTERLLNGGLLERRKGYLFPYKWAERQYKSDTSTGRVKRFRERSKTVAETSSDTEADTEHKEPPVAPRKRGAAPVVGFPLDWEMPEVASLTPKAKACATQWTKASYETAHEAFCLHWRNTRKRRPDWLGTWCVWVIREHSKVMRDQKFGNAAPADKVEQTSEALRMKAEFFDRVGNRDSAAECRQKAAALEARAA